MLIIELIFNLSLLVALSLTYTFLIRWRDETTTDGKIMVGLLFGVVSVVGMLNPFELAPGVIFDARSVILPMAGVFGGIVSASVSVAIAVAYRLFLGGEGALTGVLVILSAGAAGCFYGRLRLKSNQFNRPLQFYLLGIGVHLLVALLFLSLPGKHIREIYLLIMPAMLLVFPLATMLLGVLLNDQQKILRNMKLLKEGEEHYQLLSDATFETIFIMQDEKVVYMNKMAEKMFGFSPGDLGEFSYFDGVHPDCRDLLKRNLHEQPDKPCEIVAVRKDGSQFPAEVQGRSSQFRGENIQIAAFRDISLRTKMRDKLLKSEALFKEAQKIAQLGHWEWDLVAGDLYWSEEVYRILGLEPGNEKLSMDFFAEKIHPEDREQVMMAFNSSIRHQTRYDIEFRILLPDHSVKIVQEVCTTDYDNTGKPLRSFGIIFDITERKAAEAKVVKSQEELERLVESRTHDLINSRKAAINLMQDANEQRLRAEKALRQLKESHAEILKLSQAVEQSNAAVAITNVNGEAEYVNRTFTEFTGYEKAEVLRKRLSLLKSPDTSDLLYRELWETIRAGKSWKGELKNRHKNGRYYWVSSVISPIFNEQDEIVNFVQVAQDITSRKMLEEELLIAKEKADQATRAKSEFLANMSHEIRTPMNAILGFADLLSISATDPQTQDYLDSLKISGKNLLNLINDILDLSKVEAGMLTISNEYFNIRHLLDEIRQVFSLKIAEKGLELRVQVDKKLPRNICIDESRLRQVLINLVSNAVKYTDRGFVEIRIAVENSGSGKSRQGEYPVDLKIEVSDSGIGITENFQRVIFDSFTQEEGHDRRRHSGTGLGLAITHKLVKLMNGSVSVQSKPGEGSTFTVFFAGLSASNRQYVRGKSTAAPSWENIRFEASLVLIADDVPDNLKFLGKILEHVGLRVVSATNGQEALLALQKEIPDLVITDLRMPVMDGIELVGQIRRNEMWSKIPVVVASASVLQDTLAELKGEHFDGFLLKPLQIPTIINELKKFLKYQLQEGKVVAHLPRKFEIPVITHAEAARILPVLEQEVLPLWNEIKERQPVRKVEQFGKLMVDIGEKYDMPYLSDYGNDILNSRRSFNVEAIVRSIRLFAEILDEFKSLTK